MTTATSAFEVPHLSAPATGARRGGATPSWRRVVIQSLAVAAMAAREMSFLDHLEELRRRLIWSVICVAIVFAGCWFFATDLVAIASAPLLANPRVSLITSRPQDVFSVQVKVCTVASIFLASPFLLLQAWLFVAPGLHRHERRYAIPVLMSATTLFAAGGLFGYFIAFPFALKFLMDWTLEMHFVPNIDASQYFDLIFQVILTLGIVFQIPVVIFVLSRMGLVNARFLLKHLKYAVFGSVLIASIVTPTTDYANMLVIAGPMLALYMIGIVVAWVCGTSKPA